MHYNFIIHLVFSYLILSYDILSCLILPHIILFYLNLSYFILSYLILPYLILSYLILSYFISYYLHFIIHHLAVISTWIAFTEIPCTPCIGMDRTRKNSCDKTCQKNKSRCNWEIFG